MTPSIIVSLFLFNPPSTDDDNDEVVVYPSTSSWDANPANKCSAASL